VGSCCRYGEKYGEIINHIKMNCGKESGPVKKEERNHQQRIGVGKKNSNKDIARAVDSDESRTTDHMRGEKAYDA